MAEDGAVTVYCSSAITDAKKTPFSIKVGLAQMLRGGAVVKVSSVEQAKIAEGAGACSVMVSDLTRPGIKRMVDPSLVKSIKRAMSVPVMSRVRVGHFIEAQILESVELDYIDKSEVLRLADEDHFINKNNFRSIFLCGSRNLG